ncbi:hypothetical protein HPB47_017234 [Ixodes persulcatus]|uniref:Uncharacterized protein n=1 Tax=Ixodes persulcatus TaxID=34615 RepID=A0AC60QPT7_IXOPE|nr:hypothetical protein HPB47_017234 [Ixodes persulcatus]
MVDSLLTMFSDALHPLKLTHEVPVDGAIRFLDIKLTFFENHLAASEDAGRLGTLFACQHDAWQAERDAAVPVTPEVTVTGLMLTSSPIAEVSLSEVEAGVESPFPLADCPVLLRSGT